MKKVYDILQEIAEEPSNNKKMAILKGYTDNKTLERVIYQALSKRVKFYIKQIPEYENGEVTLTLDEALEELKVLSKREKTGHEGIAHLTKILSSLTPEDAYVIERVIDKDLKINMGSSNINKCFKNLIEKTPYMGAKPFSKELCMKFFENNKKAKSDVKMDGRYANTLIKNGDGEVESRSGEKTHLKGAKFLKELENFDDCVLNGELTMRHKDRAISRYEANGMIASLVDIGKDKSNNIDVSKKIEKFEEKHIPYQEALDSILYTCWDVITFDEYFNKKSLIPYEKRWERLKEIVNQTEMVEVVESKIVTSYKEAMEHFVEVIERGDEGTILKSLDGSWVDKKPNHQMKMKLDMHIDLRIVELLHGKKGTKNEHLLSRIVCESECGLVKSTTSNMTDEQIKYATENKDNLIGGIVEIKCCGLSQNKKGEYALLHPSFEKLRDDKEKADDLEAVKKIEQMAKTLNSKV